MSISIEIGKDHPLMPSRVLIAYDATKEHNQLVFNQTIECIRKRGDILRRGDTIVVLGVMHKFLHPMGYQMQVCPESFVGTHRAMEEDVARKVEYYVKMLQRSAEECERVGVDIEVKITAGTPLRKVVLQEVVISNATWVLLDRSLQRDVPYYIKQIPCKLGLVLENLSVQVVRPYVVTDIDNVDHRVFFSMCKPVSPLVQNADNKEQKNEVKRENKFSSMEGYGLYFKQDKSVILKGETISLTSPVVPRGQRKDDEERSSDAPILCTACKIKTEPDINDSMRFSISEIQLATQHFSEKNLLGEGGYGHVYKGTMKSGQLIAAKVRKDASAQGFAEFHSEIYILSFARHKNIVMLLGYCCKESFNILVYEYICNRSLDWHLFDNPDVLEWHKRYGIAIGTAKGLRFLHEECRGSPIIHRDMRPSNILLTHDYVPMLGDFGLAKWNISDDVETRILGTFGYLAPEYAENGIVSVRTDVYAFGIILIQLMSGQRIVDSDREDKDTSLKQWAIPLIEKLALHELIDPRLGESYDTYELYHMARAAYMCIQTDPAMRPSMAEVLHLLEGQNDYFHDLAKQFIPHFNK
ncbi:hypothetical protein Leryth_017004 [Lithospermum erythrorhizon]|nr:hypothetical protein Leryth_017004 [Lithospermum erythrorhizon]